MHQDIDRMWNKLSTGAPALQECANVLKSKLFKVHLVRTESIICNFHRCLLYFSQWSVCLMKENVNRTNSTSIFTENKHSCCSGGALYHGPRCSTSQAQPLRTVAHILELLNDGTFVMLIVCTDKESHHYTASARYSVGPWHS